MSVWNFKLQLLVQWMLVVLIGVVFIMPVIPCVKLCASQTHAIGHTRVFSIY